MNQTTFHTLEIEGLRLFPSSYGISKSGEVFLPAALAGDSAAVLMRAGYKLVSVIQHEGNVYIPLSWAKQEFPRAMELWNTCEEHIKVLALLPGSAADRCQF